MRTTVLDASHPLPVKLPPARLSPARVGTTWGSQISSNTILYGVSNTFWALSMGLTSCQPSAAQNIEVAYRFLKTLSPPGYSEHSCEQSALETARKFGGDGSVLGGG